MQQRRVEESLRIVVHGNLFHAMEEIPSLGVAQCRSDVVELLDDEYNVVGQGVVQKNFTCGMELHNVKLCPFQAAIHVTQVVDGRRWVGELVGGYLSDCLEQIVRWRAILVSWIEISELGIRIRGRKRRDCPVSLEFVPILDFCDVE